MAMDSMRSPRAVNPARPAPAAASLDSLLAPVFTFVARIAQPALRISLGIVILWIGLLKFTQAEQVAVEGLLRGSFLYGALANTGFVVLLGVFELLVAALLLLNIGARYAGLGAVLLFAGTLSIFLTAPSVVYSPSFPFLSLPGQFLLKDIALVAGAFILIAHDAARHAAGEDMTMPRLRADLAELRRRVDAMDTPTK
jgi:reactive chlorine resistance protein C